MVRGSGLRHVYRRLGRIRRRALIMGILLSGLIFALLSQPRFVWLQAKGPPTPGHELLDCQSCHQEALGTLRQQLEGATQNLLGFRETAIFIGTQPVQNQVCLECHERPLDRHPTERFWEKRFDQARKNQNVAKCTGCHLEHSGVRVTAPGDVCSNCHQDLDIEGDRVSPTHAALIASGRWKTCLQCHDFHGNHREQEFADLPGTLSEAHNLESVLDYLGSGPAIYGELLYPPREEPPR